MVAVLVLAFLCTLAAVRVNSQQNEFVETQIEKPPTDAECKPDFCPRLYKPVCGHINGEVQMAPNECEFGNQVNCIKLKQAALGADEVVFQIFYNDVCSGDEASSLNLAK